MKTNMNKNRKNSKLIVILTAISLISSTAFAQLAFINQSLNDIQKNIYLDGKNEIIRAFSDFDEMGSVEEEFIEEWMTTPFELKKESESLLSLLPESVSDEELEFECWMMEPAWIVLSEEDITIESWMRSPLKWNKKTR